MVTWMHLSTMLWVRPSDFFLALLILGVEKEPKQVQIHTFPPAYSHHSSPHEEKDPFWDSSKHFAKQI